MENLSFFYAFQLDSEEQTTNIFWSNAQMILDYGQFGDAISSDTTYKTNKENRSLAIFVGFNHHWKPFTWLLETFLEAMSNKTPKTIFTDQDSAIAKAISDIMSNISPALQMAFDAKCTKTCKCSI